MKGDLSKQKVTYTRAAEVVSGKINEENRTVEIAFSSEKEVERYYGLEILDHQKDSVRLERLNNGGAFLMEHNPGDQIGVVLKAWIDDDKRGRAIIKFSKSKRAQEMFDDVKEGIRRLVSVGYRIFRVASEKREDGREVRTALDWEPYELSLVSIPADETVGVGRNFDEPNEQKDIKNMSKIDENKTAPEDNKRSSVEVINEDKRNFESEKNDAVSAERARIAGINDVAEKSKRSGIVLDANKAINNGVSLDNFRNLAFEKLTEKQKEFSPASDLSRSEQRDINKFDLGKALRAHFEGRPLDGIERELDQEARKEARDCGISSTRGVMLPSFYVKRDMTTTAGEGGYTVATNKGGLLDDFFNKSVFQELGATILTGLVGNFDIPRLIADTDPSGKAENATSDEVSPATEVLAMKPKRLPAFIDISDQLLLQSSSAIEAMLRGHLTSQLNAIQTKAFFHGTGTNEAQGIAGTSGIGSVIGGANGAAPTFAHLVSLEEAVDAQNAIADGLAYVSNGEIRAKLKQTPKQASGVEGNFILSDVNPNVLNGYRAMFTNAVRRDLDKGTAAGECSAIFFGDFSEYVIGYWGGLNLELVRDSTNAKDGSHTLVANTYYDGGVRRPKAFSAMVDALGG